MQDNKCVICGEIIPEGLQVCPSCKESTYKNTNAEREDKNKGK